MEKRERTYLIVGGVAVGGYLLLRMYGNASANTASTGLGTTASDAAGAQYAAAQGQEQSDVAGLQAQEQSDVQNLAQMLGGQSAQEQADIAGINANQQSAFDQFTSELSGLGSQIAGFAANAVGASVAPAVPAVATGTVPVNRGAGSAGSALSSAAALSGLYLAPGAKAPPFKLTPPSAHPNAKWSGPRSPGKGWRGVGGGWWVKG